MSADQNRNPIEELAEEFIRRRRNGESPSIEQYAREHSQLADQIRELFPTLEMMEHVRDDVVDKEPIDLGCDSHVGQTLGDFQILRQIGRGGMGVVYEAHQMSLGRRVALKVLSPSLRRNKKYLERFDREARAVAKLQHANIVPVYGVATDKGLHFYVMQFVYGRGLDEVFDALCRPSPCQESADQDVSAGGLANALATGQFRAEELRVESSFSGKLPYPLHQHSVNGPSQKLAISDRDTVVDDTVRWEKSSTQSTQQFNADYYRRIAELGSRAADALAYAHRNGILHRDIKPANLLLDVYGNIWITDFGLVKIIGEEAITETGDILGTLRYLAPECLNGQFDVRSDIYGLGLTLYEMLSREKAFSVASRGELTRQILAGGIPPLLPDVPRDLSTIVHKATALEPGNRYQNAAEFCDDLNRFLGSQPIRARRVSASERLWRWSKRNRLLSLAMATCLLLLVGGLTGSLAFTVKLNALAKERQSAFVAADQESRDAKKRLVQANISRAEALAASQLPGQRFQGLSAIQDSVPLVRELNLGDDMIDRLRSAAVSSLINVDLLPIKEWNSGAGTISDVEFDRQLKTYVAQPRNFGPIEIRKVSDQKVVTRITGQDYWGWKWISPAGDYVAATTHYRESKIGIFDATTGNLIQKIGPFSANSKHAKFEFDASGQRVIIATRDNYVQVFQVGEREPIFEISSDADCVLFGGLDEIIVCRRKPGTSLTDALKVLHTGKQSLATRLRKVLQHIISEDGQYVADYISIASGKVLKSYPLSGPAQTATLGSNGMLAVICQLPPDRRDAFAVTANRPRKRIEVFESKDKAPFLQLDQGLLSVHNVDFDTTGQILIVDLYNQFALYDIRSGRRLLLAPGMLKATDGQRVAYENLGRLGIKRMELPAIYRGIARKQTMAGAAVDPLGQFLITPDSDGMRFFDLNTGSLIGFVEDYPSGFAQFFPHGNSFVVISHQGSSSRLHRWPIRRKQQTLVVGPPQIVEIAPGFRPSHLALAAGGKAIACEDPSQGKIGVYFLDGSREPMILNGPRTMLFIALSNDLTWAATGTWHGDETTIYDLQRGEIAKKIFTRKSSVAFTNDSRFLVCGNGRLIELGTWTERQIDTGDDIVAFSQAFWQPLNSPLAYVTLRNPFGRLAVVNTQDWSTLACLRIGSGADSSIVGMSGDGRLLVISESDHETSRLSILDVARLRDQLDELDLDWAGPEFPQLPDSQTASALELIKK